MNSLGVIGGVGPFATTFFYRTLVDKVAQVTGGSLPTVLIYSLPVTPEIEAAFIFDRPFTGEVHEKMERLLGQTLDLFRHARIQTVAMPCNTLQPFLEKVCYRKGMSNIKVITETAGQVATAGFEHALILGTATTRQLDMYGQSLRRFGAAAEYLPQREQVLLSQYIRQGLHKNGVGKGLLTVDIVNSIRQAVRKVDCVVIGCTDLVGQFTTEQLAVPVVDSLHVLVERAMAYILSYQTSSKPS